MRSKVSLKRVVYSLVLFSTFSSIHALADQQGCLMTLVGQNFRSFQSSQDEVIANIEIAYSRILTELGSSQLKDKDLLSMLQTRDPFTIQESGLAERSSL